LHTIALAIALGIDHSPYDCLYAVIAVAMAVDHLAVADGPFVQALRRHPDPGLAGLVLPMEEWGKKAGLA